ncbi:rho GTPase-activating protein REN1-like [Bidens hawaiensis]|uniref:rho GTPase-activating protein REN1-like n=1 Tax=Bidens hawaiensis TaxID=980011 RepID=UPI00404A7A2B
MPNNTKNNNNSDPKNTTAADHSKNHHGNAAGDHKHKPDLTKSHSASADWRNHNAAPDVHHSPPQGDGHVTPATPSLEKQTSRNGNKTYVGIGWTSWKKRWFILTETSLVFFRSDPNASSEANLTLGGIDLNSSGSVVAKADKKLITVSFPDGRDGRSFTLKAETLDDLHEWKTALGEALENAPTVGQTGISKNEKGENADGSHEHSKDRSPPKSLVLGRPVLLALEDIDGTPTFLEKALRYVEEHGVKVEGILRQAADVELVERRIQDYEQGKKTEFTADEDGHVIGDCIKYVLRELPSSPVPASCCKALLQAYRTDRGSRVSNMHAAICDTFPEPNRRLLQRILMAMEAVAEHKDVNRMSVSAVAACMSPLLLRPLLAGEVELDNEFKMDGDRSAQLMQAAAAANHAQAIIITLLEEYDNIFGEGDMLSDLYSDSDDSGSGSEELSEDDDYEDGDYSSDGSRDSDRASNSSDGGGGKAKKDMPLETLKADLMKKVEEEARHNSILKEELISKKGALRDRHIALDQEVAALKEDLQRERELRNVLEAGLMMSKKILPLPGSVDEKTNAVLADISQTEAEVISLQQKLDDLEMQLTQGKVKDKEKDQEALNRQDSKDKLHPSDSTCKDEPCMNKSSSTAVKGSNSRGEAANTNSALSKITSRIPFLKRNQPTNQSETSENRDTSSQKHQEASIDTSSQQHPGSSN